MRSGDTCKIRAAVNASKCVHKLRVLRGPSKFSANGAAGSMSFSVGKHLFFLYEIWTGVNN